MHIPADSERIRDKVRERLLAGTDDERLDRSSAPVRRLRVREVALGIRAQARGDDAEKTCDLAEAVGFAVRLSRAEVRDRARVVVDGPSVRVSGGSVRLCQVLLNLIVNAAQAMEEPSRQGLIEVRWHAQGEKVVLTVKDNGCGIPLELQKKVFQPLFTTKAIGVGTGLGLGISRDFVREAGGELTLTSAPGEGTTIEITLPLAPAGG